LESAYQRLETYAGQIEDDTLRRSFWENVAVHDNLRAAYLQSHPPPNPAAQRL
jgi:hypothetical protein